MTGSENYRERGEARYRHAGAGRNPFSQRSALGMQLLFEPLKLFYQESG